MDGYPVLCCSPVNALRDAWIVEEEEEDEDEDHEPY